MKKLFLMMLVLLLTASQAACAAESTEARIAAIKARYEALKPFYNGATYDVEPGVTAPYSIGAVKRAYLEEGLAFLNFQRFVAGVPDDITLSDDLVESGQHGAVLLAATGYLTHFPEQPEDMDKDFYDRGCYSTTGSNLSQRGGSNSRSVPIRSALMGQADDSDSSKGFNSNAASVGHRRWLLSYQMLYTGFGVADSGNNRFFAVEVVDRSRESDTLPKYILWPSAPAFPADFAEAQTPWSISLNRYEYERPLLEDITVTLTRREDGKSWIFDASCNKISSNERFMHIDANGYGGEFSYCIIFRPEGITEYSGVYDVSVSGLKDADGAALDDLRYSVEFFRLENKATDVSGSGDGGQPSGDGGSGGGCSAGWTPVVLLLFAAPLIRGKVQRGRRK